MTAQVLFLDVFPEKDLRLNAVEQWYYQNVQYVVVKNQDFFIKK